MVVLGAGAALGGAVGNLVSREWWSARRFADFIRFGDGSTGNVADLFIAVGIAAMLIGIAVWLAFDDPETPSRDLIRKPLLPSRGGQTSASRPLSSVGRAPPW